MTLPQSQLAPKIPTASQAVSHYIGMSLPVLGPLGFLRVATNPVSPERVCRPYTLLRATRTRFFLHSDHLEGTICVSAAVLCDVKEPVCHPEKTAYPV